MRLILIIFMNFGLNFSACCVNKTTVSKKHKKTIEKKSLDSKIIKLINKIKSQKLNSKIEDLIINYVLYLKSLDVEEVQIESVISDLIAALKNICEETNLVIKEMQEATFDHTKATYKQKIYFYVWLILLQFFDLDEKYENYAPYFKDQAKFVYIDLLLSIKSELDAGLEADVAAEGAETGEFDPLEIVFKEESIANKKTIYAKDEIIFFFNRSPFYTLWQNIHNQNPAEAEAQLFDFKNLHLLPDVVDENYQASEKDEKYYYNIFSAIKQFKNQKALYLDESKKILDASSLDEKFKKIFFSYIEYALLYNINDNEDSNIPQKLETLSWYIEKFEKVLTELNQELKKMKNEFVPAQANIKQKIAFYRWLILNAMLNDSASQFIAFIPFSHNFFGSEPANQMLYIDALKMLDLFVLSHNVEEFVNEQTSNVLFIQTMFSKDCYLSDDSYILSNSTLHVHTFQPFYSLWALNSDAESVIFDFQELYTF